MPPGAFGVLSGAVEKQPVMHLFQVEAVYKVSVPRRDRGCSLLVRHGRWCFTVALRFASGERPAVARLTLRETARRTA